MTTTDMPDEHVARFHEICNLYLRIGHELELLGQNEEALEAYQRATSYAPQKPWRQAQNLCHGRDLEGDES